MPTPTRAFLIVAARHGIDPSDLEAVQQWFCEDLPNLPSERIEEILEELLAYEPNGEDVSVTRHYPKDAPLPSLEESPVAATPLFAVASLPESLRALFIKLRNGREK
jgi:hypothetical protein